MEASSHGLDQHRLDGVRLAAAGFTNITRDHLDYHADFEAYFAAKLGLFERVLPRRGTAVINLDDPHGPRVRRIAKARGQRLLTVGRAEGCALRLIGQRFDATGQELLFAWGGRSHKVAARPDRRLPGAERAGRGRARHRLGQRRRRR